MNVYLDLCLEFLFGMALGRQLPQRQPKKGFPARQSQGLNMLHHMST